MLKQNNIRIGYIFDPVKLIVNGKRPPGAPSKVHHFVYDICTTVLKSPHVDIAYVYDRLSNLLQQLTVQRMLDCINIVHVKDANLIDTVEFILRKTKAASTERELRAEELAPRPITPSPKTPRKAK